MAHELRLVRSKTCDEFWYVYQNQNYLMAITSNTELHSLIKKTYARSPKTGEMKLIVSHRKFRNAHGLIKWNGRYGYNRGYTYGAYLFYACEHGMKNAIGVKEPSKIYFQIVS